MIGDPTIEQRDERRTLGIVTRTPFKGMFAVRDAQLGELGDWLESNGVTVDGPFLLRYHAIDMDGLMDIEVACVVADDHAGDDRVVPGTLPAGAYATLTYSRFARRANKTLIEWADTNDVAFDRWDGPHGDTFRCRYEAYLTDHRIEPRTSRWQVELAIKVADRD